MLVFTAPDADISTLLRGFKDYRGQIPKVELLEFHKPLILKIIIIELFLSEIPRTQHGS